MTSCEGPTKESPILHDSRIQQSFGKSLGILHQLAKRLHLCVPLPALLQAARLNLR